MQGTINEIEKKTSGGKTYHRIQIDNTWGSYWGSIEDLEPGMEVSAESKEKTVEGKPYTNWKDISPVPQGKTAENGKNDRILRCTAWKVAATMAAAEVEGKSKLVTKEGVKELTRFIYRDIKKDRWSTDGQ